MLLAAEGGGFFSSSASGYSKGLTLLLLGHKTDEKHMRITPWGHYQLVNQDTHSDLQLASRKNQLFRGGSSFVCFGRASSGVDGQSPLRVGATQPSITLDSSTIEGDEEPSTTTTTRDISVKSSLKKPSYSSSQMVKNGDENTPQFESDGADLLTERRKVQWTDACGKELAEIRVFELSEVGDSDDEFANVNGKTCSCTIM